MPPQAGPRKGKDLVHRLQVSLEDLYKGKTIKLALNKHVICSECNGKGGKEGWVKMCHSCDGRGIRVFLRQIGPTVQERQETCNGCGGTGGAISLKDRCKQCSGKKVVPEKKILEVHIDKGMKEGQNITFPGESDQAPDTIPGNVSIVVSEKPHDRFWREGNDLWHEAEIDLVTALGGGSFAILHFDDRALIVNLLPGMVAEHGVYIRLVEGALKVVRGQGMPSYRHHEPGDLYVRISVVFPQYVEPSVIPLLEKALPPRRALARFDWRIRLEEVELSELDARQQKEAEKGSGDDTDRLHPDRGVSSGGGGPLPQTRPRKSKDVVHRVRASLEDLYKGKTTKLALGRHVICGECNGKGAKVGWVKLGPTIQQGQETCNGCGGTGGAISLIDRCKSCSGKKIIPAKKILGVHIDKGMKDGQNITFVGEGNQAPDASPGDAVILVDEKLHDRFRREGNDLWHETEIDLLTALGGGSFSILHLDDRALVVNLLPRKVIEHGALKVIRGQGMPSYGHHEPGDLYVRINVVFPQYVEPSVIPLLEEALSPRRALPRFDRRIRLVEVKLSEPNAR
ncbi:Type I HSP40 co-chaperone [Tulasnella sp. 403]|nr:Type I HSP40 co-chaperone [Tulasnella sp. 403]